MTLVVQPHGAVIIDKRLVSIVNAIRADRECEMTVILNCFPEASGELCQPLVPKQRR